MQISSFGGRFFLKQVIIIDCHGTLNVNYKLNYKQSIILGLDHVQISIRSQSPITSNVD